MVLTPNSPNFELFTTANMGELDLFKRLASIHAKSKGVGVANAIGKLVDEDGRGCLHFAADGGRTNICKYLLEKLKFDVNAKDDGGSTSLHHASMKGHFDTVRYLLEKGANPNAADGVTLTPLHYAAKSGDTKIIKLLLSRGVQVDVTSRSGTALQNAACGGHLDAVKVLLDHGANPNCDTSHGMPRPLVAAMFGKSWECAELLLQAGADPNLPSYGQTPLAFAAREGCIENVTRLLEAGADPNHKMNEGRTALEIAAMECHHRTAREDSIRVLFPVTSRLLTYLYPDWSITGLMRHVNSDANNTQRRAHRQEKVQQAKSKGTDAFQGGRYDMAAEWFREAHISFPKDAALLSNLSACYARLGHGIPALEYANKCICERPKWPKAYYRKGVALNILKRYGDAADAFNQGLVVDPEDKELEDAYIVARLKSIQV